MDLYCETWGEGEPLLLLHGMGGAGGDWVHAGRAELATRHRLIIPDLRGHGRSAERFEGHRQNAEDVAALLQRLGVARCRAVGMSMGGNTLLHLAARAPERLAAMVVVSAVPYFPEQARAIMRQVSVEAQPASEWATMRARHGGGDAQIRAIWDAMRALADSVDDMAFTAAQLGALHTPTLVIHGDRDPLYPVELGVELYRALPRAQMCVVPGGGHGPIFAAQAPAFVRTTLDFLAGCPLEPRASER